MDLSILTSLGLPSLTAQIYLVALGLGTASLTEIAKKATCNRPTLYPHIETLVTGGFLEIITIGKRNYYRAANPEFIAKRAQAQFQKINDALPEIISLYQKNTSRPRISVLEGREGITQIYEEIIDTAPNLRVWSNTAQVENYFHPLSRDLAHAVKEKGIRAKEILADTAAAKQAARIYGKICGPTYSARIATVEGLGNDNIIYGNVAALFRLYEYNFFVVRIEDATMADSLRALFDMAWKSAKPFKL